MSTSINDLGRALKGEIGMSADLDVVGSAFFNGMLPSVWGKRAPPSLKNLVSWI